MLYTNVPHSQLKTHMKNLLGMHIIYFVQCQDTSSDFLDMLCLLVYTMKINWICMAYEKIVSVRVFMVLDE